MPIRPLVRISPLAIGLLAVACGGYGSVQPTPAIAIQLNLASVTLAPGQHGDVTISLTRTNYAGTVDLFVEGNAPTGVSTSFSRAPVPNEVVSTTLRITVAAGASAGTGSLIVRARGSGVADQTATIAVTVQ
jgi:serine protease